MFDFAWSEIALIGAVALIAIGPKDMPAAIRSVSGMIKKARRMAAEFQTHVDEMVREADLGDVKKAFSDIRNLNVPSLLEKHIDPDHAIRDTFAEDPFKSTYQAPAEVSTGDTAAAAEQTTAELPVAAPGPAAGESDGEATGKPVDEPVGTPIAQPTGEPVGEVTVAQPQKPLAPAFVPPGLVPPPAAEAAPDPAEPPAFIPPEAVSRRRSKA